MIVQIMGRLGKDPEMRYTPEGTAVTTISVAEDRKYTTKTGDEKKLLWWFRCTAWGKAAESIDKWFTKGKGIYIIGELVPTEEGNPRIWIDDNGKPRSSFELQIREWHFVPSSEGTGNSPDVAVNPDEEYDMPFNR